MAEYNVKYKVSSIITIVLIVIVAAGALFFNFGYLTVKQNQLTKVAELKVTEQEVVALEQVKVWTVENADYNQLLPNISIEAVKAEPNVKPNPFANKDQKE
ncbi:MAG: hypothetical protein UT32_C0023G0009 [Parcubacteria group bacterium GW2011_GWC2_39_14]|nr:MAG: hypothetical protein UT32_C0023G0009 [Parcubacteria group bacterium GW2011_GWC2_39_14]KKR53580.1 MAG: hypothetical protein UT91_C0025G0009 [Parcubacteria group bacterium GW2011_GWA2_40_23]